ncbi:hypothetical protein TREMEDRAFT_69614 [Tremella mesenterica DSM 1558]|uniref:uncharacterized protein n=1 Tax=Tremella mesenterica (strain ATCC 24925 / CBS 8224 / DSM 1558 / NBRC 9311 / NRRL Y-6157 / RJB 2259-6 / UBC 559-6) TaxID=578456 RepID=UPI0003F49A14|nr:uncharacterized protein TREMEDRAFT_69614 [Tremella mesenterica DSM 1558]EIW67504.1 hypothetical protein TREMEDRAFT_69614 [Tremella mesenterica DSM 1558]
MVKHKGQKGAKGRDKASQAPGKSIKRMESYEDTLEQGGVDEHMFKRDRIMFDHQSDSSSNDEEEVLALPDNPRLDHRQIHEDDEVEDEEEEEVEDERREKKKRKDKKRIDVSTKGRYGKVQVSDESDGQDEVTNGEPSRDTDDSDQSESEEGWGRSYYSRPSTRKEKESQGVLDEKREEERELEEKEVKRLQRKARESLGEEDWGLDDLDDMGRVDMNGNDDPIEEEKPAPPPVPETSDPVVILKHMELHDPLKLALARDYPLMLDRLERTAEGVGKMEEEKDGEGNLHKPLGWLHYQTLLTYTSTLTFYLHLISIPPSSSTSSLLPRVIARLVKLKAGVVMLDKMELDAAMDAPDWGDLDELDDLDELSDSDELDSSDGLDSFSSLDDESNEDEDQDEEGESLAGATKRDRRKLSSRRTKRIPTGELSWLKGDLEDGELEDLLADADKSPISASNNKIKNLKSDKSFTTRLVKSIKVPKSKHMFESDNSTNNLFEKQKKSKASKSPKSDVAILEEPEFIPSLRSKRSNIFDDALGDPTSLLDADASDKERRKRSLAFHTSKIASTSARRTAARERRLGGDDDVPYRDRKAARDSVLKRGTGERLESGASGLVEMNSRDEEGDRFGGEETRQVISGEKERGRSKKHPREEDDGEGESDGYYELVKRRKEEKKVEKEIAHEEKRMEKFASLQDEITSGPRSVSRAIEKNRGLTPRRSKTGRNPRVKKRQAYEKAKRRVGSQRAVFKGGQASLGGDYKGEKSGISQVVKSRKF